MDIDDRMKDLRGTGAMTQTLHFPESAGAVRAFWGGTQGGAVWRRVGTGKGCSSMLIVSLPRR
jgi:hypothetical protein